MKPDFTKIDYKPRRQASTAA
ncbi:MAG: hypothetical protein H6Q07_1831, partial [Acidobacteria bacterium]|nr:hypothetical protein [Acidobacteriota bacterium]